MTAVLALENAELTDRVTISGAIAQAIRDLDTGSSMAEIKFDEVITVEDLLYGLLLKSGNDTAVALAYYIGGTYENFINMMNDKAQELGMTSTTYTNPHGLTNDAHMTSARDMAILTMYAQQFPKFKEIVSTPMYLPQDTNLTKYSQVRVHTISIRTC